MKKPIPIFMDIYTLLLGLIALLSITPMFVHAQEQASPTLAKVLEELELQQKQAREEAQDSLVPEAIEVIEDINKAIDYILEGSKLQGLSSIERATGKIDILLVRFPQRSLLPVDYEIELFDIAPVQTKQVNDIIKAARISMKSKNYPAARLLLDVLRSEIHIRTYNLPLLIYPEALENAARLLEQNKIEEAVGTLVNNLNTLTVVDRVLPIPLINAKALLASAEEEQVKNPEEAQKILTKVRQELGRAKELGYDGNNEEYDALAKAVWNLEKQIGHKQGHASVFKAIKERLSLFLVKLQSTTKNAM